MTEQPTRFEDLEDLTVEEAIIASYEAVKITLATSVAQIMGLDPIKARQLQQRLAEEMDELRLQVVLAMRAAEVEALVD